MEYKNRIYFAIAMLDGIWSFCRWLFFVFSLHQASLCNDQYMQIWFLLLISNSISKTPPFMGSFIPLLNNLSSILLNKEDMEKIKWQNTVMKWQPVQGEMFCCRNQLQTDWDKPLSQSKLGRKVLKFNWIKVHFIYFPCSFCHVFLIYSRNPKVLHFTNLQRKGWKRHFPIL